MEGNKIGETNKEDLADEVTDATEDDEAVVTAVSFLLSLESIEST